MGRSIVAVSRGDHCVNCGTKADEISSWVGRAVELAPSVQRDINADIGVVTFAFTNPNADVASVLQRLRQDHQNSNVPVIVAWIENGQVQYECIGQGCSNLNWQEQERIACNQLILVAFARGRSVSSDKDPRRKVWRMDHMRKMLGVVTILAATLIVVGSGSLQWQAKVLSQPAFTIEVSCPDAEGCFSFIGKAITRNPSPSGRASS